MATNDLDVRLAQNEEFSKITAILRNDGYPVDGIDWSNAEIAHIQIEVGGGFLIRVAFERDSGKTLAVISPRE